MNMNKKRGMVIIFTSLAISINSAADVNRPDLTVLGYVNYRDGLARIQYNVINLLKDDLSINFYTVGEPNYREVPDDVLKILKTPADIAGKVALNFSILWSKTMAKNINLLNTCLIAT